MPAAGRQAAGWSLDPVPGLMGTRAVGYRSRMRRPTVTASAGTAPAATGTRTAVRPGAGLRPVVLATVLDACCVVVFVAIGRHAHHDGDSLAGIWHTAWPFLAGLGAGLAAARYWRQPLALAPAGISAWLGAAGAGMVIRVLAGQGTEAAFVVVAAAFLALFLLGWRELALVGNHLWRRRHSYESRG